jgi:hypothetical protein
MLVPIVGLDFETIAAVILLYFGAGLNEQSLAIVLNIYL